MRTRLGLLHWGCSVSSKPWTALTMFFCVLINKAWFRQTQRKSSFETIRVSESWSRKLREWHKKLGICFTIQQVQNVKCNSNAIFPFLLIVLSVYSSELLSKPVIIKSNHKSSARYTTMLILNIEIRRHSKNLWNSSCFWTCPYSLFNRENKKTSIYYSDMYPVVFSANRKHS